MSIKEKYQQWESKTDKNTRHAIILGVVIFIASCLILGPIAGALIGIPAAAIIGFAYFFLRREL